MVKWMNEYDLLYFLSESTKPLQIKKAKTIIISNVCNQVIKYITVTEIKYKDNTFLSLMSLLATLWPN